MHSLKGIFFLFFSQSLTLFFPPASQIAGALAGAIASVPAVRRMMIVSVDLFALSILTQPFSFSFSLST